MSHSLDQSDLIPHIGNVLWGIRSLGSHQHASLHRHYAQPVYRSYRLLYRCKHQVTQKPRIALKQSNIADSAPTQNGTVIAYLQIAAIGWYDKFTYGEHTMNEILLNLSSRIQTLIKREEGQDLVEYALIVSLIAFAATVGMSSLAGSINTAFLAIGTKLAGYTG